MPGLGGTRGNASRSGAAEIAVIRLEHSDSDAAVYRGPPTLQEREAKARPGHTRKAPADLARQDRVAPVTSLWWRYCLQGDQRAEKALAEPPLAEADQWLRK